MHADDALSLLLFALGAFLVPLGAGRVGIPSAVGEILYGIAVGPRALGLVHRNAFTSFIAELGFAFLMFLVGLEIDFSRLERERRRSIFIGVLTAVGIFAVAFLATLALQLPLFMSLVFAAMSVGIMLVTLAEVGATRTAAGQAMIFVGSVGEVLTIVGLTALGFYYRHGFGLILLVELAKLGLIFVIAYGVLVLLRTLIWWHPARFARLLRVRDPSEIGVRAGMALMLAFVAMASLMGVEPILGAFMAGALSSFVFRDKGILETKLSSIGFGFFVPLFFIWVGTEFDITAASSPLTWIDVTLYLGLSLLAKGLPCALLLLRGLSLRQAAGAALLLGAPLTLLVAISRIGLDVEVLDQASASAVVLLAIVSSVLLPWVFRLLSDEARQADDAA